MNFLTTIYKKELSYFKMLTPEGQKLLLSYFLYNTMDPLLWTFATAFLWRLSHNIIIVSWYYFAIFTGLCLGFFLNGKLLSKFLPTTLYFVGCITMALGVTLIIFLSPHTTFLIFILGILFGISCGFFWANRNFLTVRTTESNQRLYFSSLESSTSVITSVVIPALVGWFIVFGGNHFYTTQTAYEILSLIMIVVMVITGLLPRAVRITIPKIKRVTLKGVSPQWQKQRLFTVIEGSYNSIGLILPILIILSFVGNEVSLGIIQSATSIISAALLYVIGKKADSTHRFYVFTGGVMLAIVGWAFFGITYSSLGVIVYTIFSSLGEPLRWTAITPIAYDLIDNEEKQSSNHHFSYIFDWEIFLNIGRNSSLLLFILTFSIFKDNALRIIPFIFAILQLTLLALYKQLERYLTSQVKTKENTQPIFPSEIPARA